MREWNWQLSLVIPAYNEASGIVETLGEIHEALSEFVQEFEMIVVDDGSQDNTAEKVQEVAAVRSGIRLIQHTKNRGYGAALSTGFQAALYDRVAFTDADGQFDLSDLERLLPISLKFPIVCGFRINRQDPLLRKFYSWGYNKLVRFLLNTKVRDCDCALKVFRKDILGAILPKTNGFFVNAEMLCRASQLGVPIAEIGVNHRPRRAGKSKVSLLDIPAILKILIPFWIQKSLWGISLNPSLPSAFVESKKETSSSREFDSLILKNPR